MHVTFGKGRVADVEPELMDVRLQAPTRTLFPFLALPDELAKEIKRAKGGAGVDDQRF